MQHSTTQCVSVAQIWVDMFWITTIIMFLNLRCLVEFNLEKKDLGYNSLIVNVYLCAAICHVLCMMQPSSGDILELHHNVMQK